MCCSSQSPVWHTRSGDDLFVGGGHARASDVCEVLFGSIDDGIVVRLPYAAVRLRKYVHGHGFFLVLRAWCAALVRIVVPREIHSVCAHGS